MTTDDLIGMLARGAGPVAQGRDRARLALGLPVALVLATVVVSQTLGLLPPAMWADSSTGPKLVYAGLLAMGGVWLARRLGRPGVTARAPLILLGAVIAMAVLLGLADLWAADGADRLGRLMGHSALVCPLFILGSSLPAMMAILAALRTLAPVHPARAGAAAGLAAGGIAAMAYALACTEGAAAFIAAWYTLGMLLSAGLGALIGPRVLRW